MFQSRMKHLGVDYNFIREKVQGGFLRAALVAQDASLMMLLQRQTTSSLDDVVQDWS